MRNFLCILSDPPPPAPALESLLGFLEGKPVIGWKLSYDCSPQRLYTLMLAHIQSSAIYHNLWFNLPDRNGILSCSWGYISFGQRERFLSFRVLGACPASVLLHPICIADRLGQETVWVVGRMWFHLLFLNLRNPHCGQRITCETCLSAQHMDQFL